MKHLYTRALVCLCLPVMLLACRNEATQEIGMYTSYQFPDTATVVKTTSNNVYCSSQYVTAIPSYYLEGYDGVPFINTDAFVTLWSTFTGVTASNIEMTRTNSAVTITRTDTTPNVSLTIDAAAQTISSANLM